MTSVATRAKSLAGSAKIASAGVRSTRQPLHEYSATPKDRFYFAMETLAGRWVSVQLTDGRTFDGILNCVDGTQGKGDEPLQRELILLIAKERLPLDAKVVKPEKMLAFKAEDIVMMEACDVNMFYDESAGGPVRNKGRVEADAEIEVADRARLGKERELVAATAWLDGAKTDGSLEGSASVAYKPGWDQFAVNEKLTGTQSNYSEELYTTKLCASDFSKDQIEHARRLAREIEGKATDNIHVAEERGQRPLAEADDMDEEDKYSTVLQTGRAGEKPVKQAAAKAPQAAPDEPTSSKLAVESKPTSKPAAQSGKAAIADAPPAAAARPPPPPPPPPPAAPPGSAAPASANSEVPTTAAPRSKLRAEAKAFVPGGGGRCMSTTTTPPQCMAGAPVGGMPPNGVAGMYAATNLGAMGGSPMMAGPQGGLMYAPMGSPQAMGLAPAGMGGPRSLGGMMMVQRPVIMVAGPGGQMVAAHGGMVQPGMAYPGGMMPMSAGGTLMGQAMPGGVILAGGPQGGMRPAGARPMAGPQQMMRPGMMPAGGQMQHGYMMPGPAPGGAYAPQGYPPM